MNKKNGEVFYLTSPFLLFDFDFFLHVNLFSLRIVENIFQKCYIKFIRPKQASKVSADPDDYDFADEEEYINEDEPEPEEEMEDTK